MVHKINPINETLNILLIKISSGVNYASKLAIETKKSIPVVFRQLDQLVQSGILEKKRQGKKVEYHIRWTEISKVFTSILELDFKEASDVLKQETVNSGIIKELKELMKEYKDSETLKNRLEKSSNELLIQDPKSFQLLFKELDNEHMNFKQSLGYFLDSLGMLDIEQQKKFIKKFKNEKPIQDFLKIARIHYLFGLLADPRRKFVDKLFK